FVMSYDDHEVENDWAGDTNEKKAPPELFVLRRAAAFQAWYEHLPLRRAQLPRGPDILAYRRFAVGDLLSMNVLDTRLFRSPQACADGPRPQANCAAALEPNRTMLGEAPESGRHYRRRSPELGSGAEEEFRRREICDARRRVRGDVGFLARRRLRHQRPLQGAAAAGPAPEVLQRPARLRSPHCDAAALAGRLPSARQGHRARWPPVDAQELRGREWQA